MKKIQKMFIISTGGTKITHNVPKRIYRNTSSKIKKFILKINEYPWKKHISNEEGQKLTDLWILSRSTS